MSIILHVDMNSYFASVEQQARPALRGKPVGVTGPSKRSIIVAASVEAKKFGVKTGTLIHEAKKLCPQIILVKADCNRYESVTRQFLEIFITKTPQVEIFSIDEAFLDLSLCNKTSSKLQRFESLKFCHNFKAAEKVALEIKRELRQRVGKFVRCSIGIAQNKFMAKLASEAHKPDGLTIVSPGQETEFLDQFELTDACGIGRGISAHLTRLGVKNFKDLRALDQATLTLIFKSYGLRLYNMARGIDNDPIHPYYLAAAPRSISRSKTLPQNTFDQNLIEKMALSFCQNIASELRGKNLLGGSIAIWFRYGDFTHFGERKVISTPTNHTSDLFFHAKKILKKIPLKKSIRKVGLYVGNLSPDSGQLHFFSDRKKSAYLDSVVDKVNQKYGREIITRSSLVDLNFGGKSPSYGFKKNLF